MKNFYAFWLNPSEEDSLYLGNIIQSLAFEYKSQTFFPHLTLYGTVLMEQKEAVEMINKTVLGITPFTIQVENISHSNEFFKSLFLQIKSSDELTTLFNSFQRHLEGHIDYKFNPHISLLYQHLTAEQKEVIAQKLKVKNEFLMKSISLINLGVTHEDIYKINQWKVEYTKVLQ